MIFLEPLDARIPQWNLNHLLTRLCPFCRVENELVLMRSDRLPVAFCKTCGCWYVAELPSIKDIQKQYDGYWHIHNPTDLSEKMVPQMLENARKASQTDWQFNTLSKLLGGISGKRILDVGCGCGQFILTARSAGADVVGCDISPEACNFVKTRLGITVHNSNLQKCLSSIGNVDAVVMRDLIEHPVEPLMDIQAAYNILKQGGLLLLLTPNGGEAGSQVETGKKWVGFSVDLEHLQYLSSQTINWLSKTFGWRIERLECFGFPCLEGIDQFPNKMRRNTNYAMLKEIAKLLPGARQTNHVLQAIKAGLTRGHQDLRLGSYHLFAILRKVV